MDLEEINTPNPRRKNNKWLENKNEKVQGKGDDKEIMIKTLQGLFCLHCQLCGHVNIKY